MIVSHVQITRISGQNYNIARKIAGTRTKSLSGFALNTGSNLSNLVRIGFPRKQPKFALTQRRLDEKGDSIA
jgi:hypothetical protein